MVSHVAKGRVKCHMCSYCPCVYIPAQGKERDSWEPPEWVPRVRLHFEAEDPFVFARRFADAHERRARSESLLRYSLYVDSMPMEDLPALTTEAVSRAERKERVVGDRANWARAAVLR